jgi:ribbon-helix-helix CopG family protein
MHGGAVSLINGRLAGRLLVGPQCRSEVGQQAQRYAMHRGLHLPDGSDADRSGLLWPYLLGGRPPQQLIDAIDALAAAAEVPRSEAMRQLIEAGLKGVTLPGVHQRRAISHIAGLSRPIRSQPRPQTYPKHVWHPRSGDRSALVPQNTRTGCPFPRPKRSVYFWRSVAIARTSDKRRQTP